MLIGRCKKVLQIRNLLGRCACRMSVQLRGEVLPAYSQEYKKEGCIIFRDLINENIINKLKKEARTWIQNDISLDGYEHKLCINDNSKDMEHYLFSSATDIIPFFGCHSIGDHHNLAHLDIKKDSEQPETLKFSYRDSIAKYGHAIHDVNEVFEEYSYSSIFKQISTEIIGLEAPIIVKSSYYLQNPISCEGIQAHKDSSFILTSPCRVHTIITFLDDLADAEAICIVGGSHKYDPEIVGHRCLVDELDENGMFLGQRDKLLLVQNEHSETRIDSPDLEGSMEETIDTYFTDGVILDMKQSKNIMKISGTKGTVLCLHGNMTYFFQGNSTKERHIYVMNIVDSRNTQWLAENWLIRTAENPFRLMKTVNIKPRQIKNKEKDI